MASTTSNLELTALANDALAALLIGMDDVKAFSFKADGNKQLNDSVVVYVNSMTGDASEFDGDTNDYETDGDDSTVGVPVTLNKRIKKTFSVDDVDASRIDIRKKLVECTNKVSEAALKFVYDELTAAKFPTAPAFTGAATAFDYDTVVDLDDVADEAGLARTNRTMILDNRYASNLKKDGHLVTLRNSQGSTVEGQWAAVSSFNVLSSVQLKNSANYATTENLRGFIGDGSGVAVAMGSVPAPSGQGTTQYSEVDDPESGFTVCLRSHYSDTKGKTFYTVEIAFGVKVTRATGLIRLVSA